MLTPNVFLYLLLISCLTPTVETPPEVLSVSWYHNGQKVEPNDRYRLSDEGGGWHMLEINPTELGDDGEWKAVVKNEGGYTTSLANLTLSGECYLCCCWRSYILKSLVLTCLLYL